MDVVLDRACSQKGRARAQAARLRLQTASTPCRFAPCPSLLAAAAVMRRFRSSEAATPPVSKPTITASEVKALTWKWKNSTTIFAPTKKRMSATACLRPRRGGVGRGRGGGAPARAAASLWEVCGVVCGAPQVVERLDRLGEEEVEGAEGHERKHIRGVDDHHVAGDADHRGDRVDGEDHVRQLDHHEDHEQRRRLAHAVHLGHELLAVVVVGGVDEAGAGRVGGCSAWGARRGVESRGLGVAGSRGLGAVEERACGGRGGRGGGSAGGGAGGGSQSAGGGCGCGGSAGGGG